jgi:hypothetical protein
MARAGRGDSRRETAGHIPVVTIVAGGLEAVRLTIVNGMEVSRDV